MNQPIDLNLLPQAYQSKRGITAVMVINILLTITLTMSVFTAYQQLILYRQRGEALALRREQLQLELVRRGSLQQSITELEARLQTTQEQTAQLRREFSALMQNRPRRSENLATLIERSAMVTLTEFTQTQDVMTLVGEAPDTETLLAYARIMQDKDHFQRASILSFEQVEDRVRFTMMVSR